MKKTAFFFLLFLLFFPISAIYADSSVTIINNTSGSNTTSNITSQSSSSTYHSSSQNCHTHVVTNGQAYDSDNCDDVHIQNGGSTVNISNNAGNSVTQPPIPTVSNMPTISITPPDINPTIGAEEQKIKEKLASIAAKTKEVQAQHENFFQRFEKMIKQFFAHFF